MSDEWCTCGFTDESVQLDQVPARVAETAARWADLLNGNLPHVASRPEHGRWSMLEYAGHVRDVLLTIRDRTVIGLVEDNPSFKPMYRDERVSLGLYGADTVDDVVDGLRAVAGLYGRMFSTLRPELLERPVLYGFPSPDQRTVGWMGRQAVHEMEHHLTDAQENLALLRP